MSGRLLAPFPNQRDGQGTFRRSQFEPAALVASAYLVPCLPVIVRDLLTTENKELK